MTIFIWFDSIASTRYTHRAPHTRHKSLSLDQFFHTQGIGDQYKLYCQLERTLGRSLKALAGPDLPSKPKTAIILLGLRSW